MSVEIGTAIWRSLLFVPAHNEEFIAKAAQKGADAVILDLEDSVPAELKSAARESLAGAVNTLREAGVGVLLRVNADEELNEDDLAVGASAGVDAFVLPKVEDAARVQQADDYLHKQGCSALLMAQIEHVNALPNLDAIATSSERLLGLSLGTEDFSASAGMLPTPKTLYGPSQAVVFACRRAGIAPYGFPASIAEFSDMDALRGHIEDSRDMGFVGAMCVHPNQVTLLNQILSPTQEQIDDARALIEAVSAASSAGDAAFNFNGKMVDKPVIERAEELLKRAEQIAQKERN